MGPGTANARRELTISLVSHGHAALVQGLLQVLCERHEGLVAHVILTHNIAEPALAVPAAGWPFRVTELANARPRGFGANHNQAFGHCDTGYFCVLNPDVALLDGPLWAPLLAAAEVPGTGCAYPRLYNPDTSPQDNEREAVTPAALLRRHLLRGERRQGRRGRRVDWVSAAFWVVPRGVYQALGGFDERYFMYCEDTDFCLRLQLAGWSLRRAEAGAVHAASRASRRLGPHLAWHLRSLLRLWAGPVLRNYLTGMRDGGFQKTPRQ